MMIAAPPVPYNLIFATATGNVSLPITAGSVTLVAGPNGVGKSALLAALYRSLPLGVATYLPGHRQINFNNGWETIGQDAAQLLTNMFQHPDHFSRYKGAWAEDQFKTVVRRLLHLEAAYNREFRKNFSEGVYDKQEAGSIRLSPVDTLNLVFEGARLPVRFVLSADGLSAERGNATYPIDAMSDGERSALFIVSTVVTQSPNTVVLIDEPEKHLHPSITASLLETCIRARADISIVVSSHDVLLIERLTPDHVIHIRDSEVMNTKPEVRVFDAQVLTGLDRISDDLRTELLGARSAILFVEGEADSNDIALYNHVYESVKVSPRGGHGKVQEAVGALRSLPQQHWLTPYGIIDGDGRDAAERVKLSEKGIFVLPCPSIENIFFYDEMIACFIEADVNYSGGASLESRLADLANRCISVAARDKREIVALQSSWLLERALSSAKLSPLELKRQPLSPIRLDVNDIVSSVEARVEELLQTGDWKMLITGLPIKKTGLANECARALGAGSFREYCAVILRQFDIQSEPGIVALNAIKERLPLLN